MSATPEAIRDALSALVGKVEPPPPVLTDGGADSPACRLVRQLVESFLIWESSLSRAKKALESIRKELADANELRVCLPSELIGIVGGRYPRVEERCHRLRSCLNAIFERENCVQMNSLETASKRDARTALDAIEGMVPFVSARIVLLELGGHAFPVDSRVRNVLKQLGDQDDADAVVAAKLERVFRAGEIGPVYAALEQSFDRHSGKSSGPKSSRKAGTRAP